MKRAVLLVLGASLIVVWAACDSEPPTGMGEEVEVAPMMARVSPPTTHYQMAYTEFPDGYPEATDVYYLDTKGKAIKKLTTHSGRDQMPSWSPDGAEIVFSTTMFSTGNALEDLDLAIMEVAADGTPGAITRITSEPGQETYAAWSPDGTKIAYVCEVSPWPGPRFSHLCYSERAATGGWSGPWLLTMDPPPFLPPPIPELRFKDTHPTWSPDGNWVLFSRWCILGPCAFSDRELFMAPVIPAGGPVPPFPRQVTKTPGVNEDNPSWRPTPAGNGDIAYNAVTYSMKGPVEVTSEDIYSVTMPYWPPLPWPNPPPITTSGTTPVGTQLTSTGDNDYPWWSPDGNEILFLSWRDLQWDLFRMLASGMLERNLTGTPSTSEGFGRIRPVITP